MLVIRMKIDEAVRIITVKEKYFLPYLPSILYLSLSGAVGVGCWL